MVKIAQMDVEGNGNILVKFQRDNGNVHRLSYAPGAAIDVALPIDWQPEIRSDLVGPIRDFCEQVWTSEVVAAHAASLKTEPPPTEESYGAAIQAHIDATAQAKGYADGVALSSYITSTIPAWRDEAAAFVLWRDSVWSFSHDVLGQVLAGQRAKPSIKEMLAELPAISWPT